MVRERATTAQPMCAVVTEEIYAASDVLRSLFANRRRVTTSAATPFKTHGVVLDRLLQRDRVEVAAIRALRRNLADQGSRKR